MRSIVRLIVPASSVACTKYDVSSKKKIDNSHTLPDQSCIMIKNLCCCVLALVSICASGQQMETPIKQSMFRDLRVTNTITRSIRDTIFTFHVEAIDEDDMQLDLLREYYWFHQGEIRKTQGNYTGKVLHGPFEKFDRDGYLLTKGTFNHGLKTGVWLNWHTNGKIAQQCSWKDGYRIGRFVEYYPSGAMLKTGNFKRGKFHRTVTYFAPDGTIIREEKYVKGKIVKTKEKERWFKRNKNVDKEPAAQDGKLTLKSAPATDDSKKNQANVPGEKVIGPDTPKAAAPTERKRLFRRGKQNDTSGISDSTNPRTRDPQSSPAVNPSSGLPASVGQQPQSVPSGDAADDISNSEKKKRKKKKQGDSLDPAAQINQR